MGMKPAARQLCFSLLWLALCLPGIARSDTVPTRWVFATTYAHTDTPLGSVPDTVVILDVIPVPQNTAFNPTLQVARHRFVQLHAKELGIFGLDVTSGLIAGIAEKDRERVEKMRLQEIEGLQTHRTPNTSWIKYVKIQHGYWFVKKEVKPADTEAIDDALSKLDKQSGTSGAGTGNSVDDAFGAMEAELAEKERQRLLAIERKRKAEAERIAQIGPHLRILSPRNRDRINARVTVIRGDTQGYGPNETLQVHFNNAVQQVTTNAAGEFSTSVVLTSGNNAVSVCYGTQCSAIAIQADIERLALMATLTWEGRGDLDLHITAPGGETCYYSAKHRPGICTLDIDDTKGINPENMSVPIGAPKGSYRFSVINYSGVSGVSGTLKLYQDEKLVATRSFYASGERGSEVLSEDLANYK